ncbi:hypothetical protein [Paragemmobacter ruber]|uniref:Integral membrane protein n=1 Tax=Paragemmobacter ruber TaxID=1985673 RepID=A0ABW9Y7F0_9RHOB|nr:hypothetical protein [Rhodobacter ruber]NBE08006.1 hypothetical protein [Rhodobacter ruber]
MKTTIFTLAALFGLGLGLVVVGADFGLVILGLLLALAGAASLTWTLVTGLRPYLPGTRLLWALPPLLSALMGLSLGAALAQGSADLPAALLCGALAGLLHLLAVWPATPATAGASTPPHPAPAPDADRIAATTATHLARLIRALAPCRDPHLHRAACALRRAALTLAEPSAPPPPPEAAHALTLWLPALADAAEALRLQHLAAADPARPSEKTAAQTAALTEALARVTTRLSHFAPPPAPLPETALGTGPGTARDTSLSPAPPRATAAPYPTP